MTHNTSAKQDQHTAESNSSNKGQDASMFRQAAIDASFMQQYGNVCMLPTFNQVALFCLPLILLVLIGVYISTQSFFETVNVTGWVNTKTPNIEVRSQESAGIVKQVLVANGSQVKAGDTIAVITRSLGQALGDKGIDAKRKLILQEQSNRLAILNQNSANAALALQGIDLRYIQSSEQITKIEDHKNKHQIQLDIAKQGGTLSKI